MEFQTHHVFASQPPSGILHLGNWVIPFGDLKSLAKKHAQKLLLRIDDLDQGARYRKNM